MVDLPRSTCGEEGGEGVLLAGGDGLTARMPPPCPGVPIPGTWLGLILAGSGLSKSFASARSLNKRRRFLRS
jgi:hypothetical protein